MTISNQAVATGTIMLVGRSEKFPDWHPIHEQPFDTFGAILVANALTHHRTEDGDEYREVLLFHASTGEACGHFARSPQMEIAL